MAEREGFEPSKQFPVYTLSKRACSTTPPPLRNKINNLRGHFLDSLMARNKEVFITIH